MGILYIIPEEEESQKALEILSLSGISFKIFGVDSPKIKVALFGLLGISYFPTLDMGFGKFHGLEQIKNFLEKSKKEPKHFWLPMQ